MKTKFFALLAVSLFLFVGCAPKEEEPQPVAADYVGTVNVEYQGAINATPDIRVHFEPSADGTTATLVIYKIKFVPQMPVTIDVTVPGLSVHTSDGVVTFTGEGIIPEAMGGPVDRYRVTGMSGTQRANSISFQHYFGEYPTTFTGTLQAL